MCRSLCRICFILILIAPTVAQAQCESSDAVNTALEAAQLSLERNNTEQAIEQAERAVEIAGTCFAANLGLLQAYFRRFDDVEGIAALALSRKFRQQLRTVRQMRPDNIEARRMEILYLYQAPRIAGGSKSKAKSLVTQLEEIDPRMAYLTRLQIGRYETDEGAVLALLNEYPATSVDELHDRLRLVRTLIIDLGNYTAADLELAMWENIAMSEDIIVERLLLRGVLRVLGEFEFEEAENYLVEFVERRSGLPEETMEPASIGYAFLGDARRLGGNAQSAVQAYEAALVLNPETKRAQRGLAALSSD